MHLHLLLCVFRSEILVPIFVFWDKPLCAESTVCYQLRHASTGGVAWLIVVEA